MDRRDHHEQQLKQAQHSAKETEILSTTLNLLIWQQQKQRLPQGTQVRVPYANLLFVLENMMRLLLYEVQSVLYSIVPSYRTVVVYVKIECFKLCGVGLLLCSHTVAFPAHRVIPYLRNR